MASFAKTIARSITASVSTTPSIRIVQLSMRARTGAGNSLRVGTTAGMLKPFSKLPVQVRAKGPQARGSAIHSGFSQVSRSEEHTSELQSLMRISYAVFCLKKKQTSNISHDKY